jgi:hypothetical protein
MSHISAKKRRVIEVFPIGKASFATDRELSFALSLLMKQFIEQHPSELNRAVGAIDNAKSMFREKHVIPFEKQEAFDHGDIK